MVGFFFRFVDISKLPLHDHYIKQYADVLYRWNLLGKRAEVIKFLSEPQQPHNGVGKWGKPSKKGSDFVEHITKDFGHQIWGMFCVFVIHAVVFKTESKLTL